MFVYLVAFLATLLIIFGLAYTGSSNDWVRSSIRNPLSLYHEFNYRATNERRRSEENLTENEPARNSSIEIGETTEYEIIPGEIRKSLFNADERLTEEVTRDVGKRNLGALRYSLENILQSEKEKDTNLPGARGFQQVGTSGSARILKQETNKENILQTLKSSAQKGVPTSKLTTNQIYNLILKETLKEKKFAESDKGESDRLAGMTNADQFASASKENEGKLEREDETKKPSGVNDEKTYEFYR